MSNKLQMLLNVLDSWEEIKIDNFIMNPTHHLGISDTLKCSYGHIFIKNTFKIITRQFLVQLKREYSKTQKSKNILLWVLIDNDYIIDLGFIVNLMDELKIDKITVYDSIERNKAFGFTFTFNNTIYYGALATRVIDQDDNRNDFKNFLKITFTRKTNLRNL